MPPPSAAHGPTNGPAKAADRASQPAIALGVARHVLLPVNRLANFGRRSPGLGVNIAGRMTALPRKAYGPPLSAREMSALIAEAVDAISVREPAQYRAIDASRRM